MSATRIDKDELNSLLKKGCGKALVYSVDLSVAIKMVGDIDPDKDFHMVIFLDKDDVGHAIYKYNGLFYHVILSSEFLNAFVNRSFIAGKGKNMRIKEFLREG